VGKPRFSDECKRDAVAQITEREYPVAEVSQPLGVNQIRCMLGRGGLPGKCLATPARMQITPTSRVFPKSRWRYGRSRIQLFATDAPERHARAGMDCAPRTLLVRCRLRLARLGRAKSLNTLFLRFDAALTHLAAVPGGSWVYVLGHWQSIQAI
jgi:hypothetical protein